MSPPRSDGDARIPVVDLVRLLSIVLVMGVHFPTSKLGIPWESQWALNAWRVLVRNGVYGVSIFFVVSGYVISRSLARNQPELSNINLREFYIRRAARILPLLVLTVTIGAVAMALLPDSPALAHCLKGPAAVFDAAFWLSLFTFSFNWLRIAREPGGALFGLHWDILWSLAVEEQFYLVYPWLLKRLRTRKNVLSALLLIVTLGPVARGVSILINPDSFLLTFTNSFVCFDLLALGALLYFTLESLPAQTRAWEPWLALLSVVTGVCVYTLTLLRDPHDRVWAPSMIGLCVAVFMAVGIRGRWFSHPLFHPLTYPGQLSYGAYLFHPLVLWLTWDVLDARHHALGFPLFVTFTLAVSLALYTLYERPARQLIRRRFSAVTQQKA